MTKDNIFITFYRHLGSYIDILQSHRKYSTPFSQAFIRNHIFHLFPFCRLNRRIKSRFLICNEELESADLISLSDKKHRNSSTHPQRLPDNTCEEGLSDLSHWASIRDNKDSRSCMVSRWSITSIKFLPTCFSLTLLTWDWIN